MPDEPITEESQPQETNDQVNAGVAKAGGIMVFSLLMSRVLGIVRDIIITFVFGINGQTDAYRYSFMLPDLLFFLISGGALSSAFIPVFSEYWHTNRQKDAWRVFSGVMCIVSVFLVIFVTLCGVFADPLYRNFLARGIQDKSLIPEIVGLSRILLPAQFAFFLGGLMMGTLYARKVFTIPGLGPNIYNLGIIFGAVVLSRFVDPKISGMCWGAAGGAIVGNLIIPYLGIRKLGMEFHLGFNWNHEGVKKVFKLMLPVILGLSLPGVFAMIMIAFGSYFPLGTNTILDLSNKLMQAPLGIFGQSLAIAVFPVLTQFYAQNRMDMFRNQLDRTMRTVLYLTIPISVLLAILAPQIASGLYLSHKVTADQTAQIAVCLQIFCIGIWAWCLHPVLMRAFYSLQDTVTPIVVGTLTTAFFVGMLITLMKTPLTYRALPLAGSISPILMVIALCLIAAKKLGGMDFKGLIITFGKSAAASSGVALICSIVAWTPISRMMWGHRIATLIIAAVTFCVAMWVYYFITKALKMPECEYLDRVMNKINRNKMTPKVG
jgi:putative peptidoglycan lipid II flippase